MYNSEQKNRYLKNCKYEETTKELLKRIFDSTELEEEAFDKDLALFTHNDVYDLLLSLNSKSRKRLRSTCIFLSDYFMWCYKEGLTFDLNNPYDKRFTEVMIEKILPIDKLNLKYFNYITLNDYVNNSIIDVSNKFIAYALYCGITSEELRNLKKEDLNVTKKQVTLITGRNLTVDDLFVKLLMEADNQTQYFPDGIIKESKFNKYDYGISKYVLKTCVAGECGVIKDAILIARLKVIKEQCENDFITLSTLYKNGLFHYLKLRYEEKNITLQDAHFTKQDGAKYKYESETQQYISEFGSTMTSRALRKEVKDNIHIFSHF